MDISKDIDSQPLTRVFSFSNQKDRAFYGLKGILTRVVADQRLNEMELLFLDTSLKSQEFLSEGEDVLDILRLVGEIFEDGGISPDELVQIQSRVEQIISSNGTDGSKEARHIESGFGF